MENEDRSSKDFSINNKIHVSHDKTEAHPEIASSSFSGTCEILNKNDIIRKEIDQLFGPALERTRSGSEIEVAVPLRQKKRQCRSQEVLSVEKLGVEHEIEKNSTLPRSNGDHNKMRQVSVLYDNQRAEIVASVTERLYNKLKQNEKAVSKMESMVDKKIMQPLHELKICSNARQRLVELSQKAMRHKRKIGIPAYTQTKKYATRVKDQETDVQNDLQPYCSNKNYNSYCVLKMDVSTETIPFTPRCKEVAVGSKSGTLNGTDQSTLTESSSKTYKNSFTMTDTTYKCDSSTQTFILPPPRKKKNLKTLSKYFKKSDTFISNLNNKTASPIVNITISPIYSKETHSSDEPSDVSCGSMNHRSMIPDICEGLNPIHVENEAKHKEVNNEPNEAVKLMNISENKEPHLIAGHEIIDDFSDEDDVSILPRIAVEPSRKIGRKDYEELILGHNSYPYNLKLSPYKEIDKDKRVIKFNNIDITPAECCSTKWLGKISDEFESINTINQFHSLSEFSKPLFDSTIISKTKLKSKNYLQSTEAHFDSKSDHIKVTAAMQEKLHKTADYCKTSKTRQNHNYKKPLLKSSITKTELNNGPEKNSVTHENFKQYNDTNHMNGMKLTPTEYLKTLIQIRREAVAAGAVEEPNKKSLNINFSE